MVRTGLSGAGVSLVRSSTPPEVLGGCIEVTAASDEAEGSSGGQRDDDVPDVVHGGLLGSVSRAGRLEVPSGPLAGMGPAYARYRPGTRLVDPPPEPEDSDGVGINVLGPLTVDGPGRLGPHDRVVLQALATRLGQPVSADELVDAVWGDRPPASATKNLQSSIVKIRKVLGAAAIETSHHGYVLAVPPDQVDAHDFEERVTRARALLTVGENDRVAFLMEQALARGAARPTSTSPTGHPARREAGRLDELRLEAQEMHVEAMLRSGRPREVLALAHSLVRAAPLRERRWELLVLAQYQTGAQGEALRSLRQLRAVLARELGIDPSPRCWPWSSRSSTRTPVSWSRSSSTRGQHGVRGRASWRTTSTTPSGSSAATRTSPRAWRSCPGDRSSRWWVRPGRASPPSSVQACWRPCAGAAIASSSSRRGRDRCSR